ncbi:MAG: amidohydrolase family protein [Candidatus Geothermarchaeales archaeon]
MRNFDMVIRSGRLRGAEGLHDVGISQGRIAALSEKVDGAGDVEIDASGRLVTGSFVIAHLHLDKVMTGGMVSSRVLESYQEMSVGGATSAVDLAAEVKERYDEGEIEERARRVLENARSHGVTHVRAFADVDTRAELKGVKPLLKLRDEFGGSIDLQVVAFPQQGILRDPGSEALLWKSMEMGADVMGGIPWIERTNRNAERHIDIAFGIAREFGKDVAMLVDDAGDPDLRTLEYLALRTIQEGYLGRVAACHARAMALYDETYFRELTALLKRAELGVVTNPHTGPLHVRVRDLLDAGIPVALGQDDVYDTYYPYGRCNMLEVAFLASHLLWMMTPTDMEILYDMITTHPANVMGLDDYGLHVGARANLVVLNARSVREALTHQSTPAYVVSHGSLVAQTDVQGKNR